MIVEADGADGPKDEECFSAAGKRTYAEVAKTRDVDVISNWSHFLLEIKLG